MELSSHRGLSKVRQQFLLLDRGSTLLFVLRLRGHLQDRRVLLLIPNTSVEKPDDQAEAVVVLVHVPLPLVVFVQLDLGRMLGVLG